MLLTMPDETLKTRIEQKLAERDMSARAASLEAGGSPDLLRPLLTGRTESLRMNHLVALAKVLDTTPEWLLTGRHEADNPMRNEIFEIDVRAGAGGGGVALTRYVPDGNGGHIEVDDVTATWSIPPAYVRGELRTDPRRLYIVEVLGDSMSPTLLSGDRLMIDTGHTQPSPDGIYALHDGYGLIVKRIELVRGTDPQQVRVISDNPHHNDVVMTLEEARIVGRVVARITVM